MTSSWKCGSTSETSTSRRFPSLLRRHQDPVLVGVERGHPRVDEGSEAFGQDLEGGGHLGAEAGGHAVGHRTGVPRAGPGPGADPVRPDPALGAAGRVRSVLNGRRVRPRRVTRCRAQRDHHPHRGRRSPGRALHDRVPLRPHRSPPRDQGRGGVAGRGHRRRGHAHRRRRCRRRRRTAGRAGPGSGRRRRRDYHLRLERRLLAGDEAGAWTIIENALTAGLDPEEVYLEVLAPAMAAHRRGVGGGHGLGGGRSTGRRSSSCASSAARAPLHPAGPQAGHGRARCPARRPPRRSRRPRRRPAAGRRLRRRRPRRRHARRSSFVEAGRGAERLVGIGISATTYRQPAGHRGGRPAVHRELGCPVVLGGQAIPDGPTGTALGADEVTGERRRADRGVRPPGRARSRPT